MIKTLDRYIIRSFLVSAALWLLVLLLLRTTVDLFVNIDEFAEIDLPLGSMVLHVADFYGYQIVAFFLELGGVTLVAAAAFTLARMNQTNELTAMLASGVSLHRVVWPIILCSMGFVTVLILVQELVIPPIAPKLARQHDYAGEAERFQVRLLADTNRTVWWAMEYQPSREEMSDVVIALRDSEYRLAASVTTTRAVPGRLDEQTGWVARRAEIASVEAWPHTQSTDRVHSTVRPAELNNRPAEGGGIRHFDPAFDMVIRARRLERPGDPSAQPVLVAPRFTFGYRPDPGREDIRTLATITARRARWVPSEGDGSSWRLEDGEIFVPSDLSPSDVLLKQSGKWLQYMSFAQLARLLRERDVPNRRAVRMTQHLRVTEPINHLIMLLLAVPFIVSRERNIRTSAGLCLLMVGTFYAFVYLCRYVGLPPIWSAWAPTLVFGPVAAVALDSIRT